MWPRPSSVQLGNPRTALPPRPALPAAVVCGRSGHSSSILRVLLGRAIKGQTGLRSAFDSQHGTVCHDFGEGVTFIEQLRAFLACGRGRGDCAPRERAALLGLFMKLHSGIEPCL